MTKKNVGPKKVRNQHKRPTFAAKVAAAMREAGATKQMVKATVSALKTKKKAFTLKRTEVKRIVDALELHGRIVVSHGKGIKCYTLEGYRASVNATKRNKPHLKKLAKKA
jgi:hypothetical protein